MREIRTQQSFSNQVKVISPDKPSLPKVNQPRQKWKHNQAWMTEMGGKHYFDASSMNITSFE